MQQLERTKTESSLKNVKLLNEKYTFVVFDVRWYVKTNTKDVKLQM